MFEDAIGKFLNDFRLFAELKRLSGPLGIGLVKEVGDAVFDRPLNGTPICFGFVVFLMNIFSLVLLILTEFIFVLLLLLLLEKGAFAAESASDALVRSLSRSFC